MKQNWELTIYPAIILGVFTIFTTSCNKDEVVNDGIMTSTAIFNEDLSYGTLSDNDGNTYKTIEIGTQTWMAENLRTTLYNDGSSILFAKTVSSWKGDESGAYCNYNNETQEDTIATYGRLYNWYSVNTEKLCPSGWHVPSKSDWEVLVEYIDNTDLVGGYLKEASKAHWYTPNSHATNESGFTALPGGARFKGGSYGNLYYYGYWWTSTSYSDSGAYAIGLYYYDADISMNGSNINSGYSVRCLKD